MGGMATGPWSYPAELPLFAATWVAMTAAMMLPAITPTVLAYEGRVRRRRGRRTALGLSLAFVAAYLAVWAMAGVVPYALLMAGGALDGQLFMGGAGRDLAVGVLVAAAAYQLLPAKRACLRRLCGPPAHVGEEAPGGAARALSTTRAPAGPSAPAPAAAPGAGVPTRCQTGDVSATLTQGSPGAGQRYAALTLTNRSGHACQVYGYVGMLLLDAGGQPLPTSVGRTPPSPSPVVVQPGGHVSAQLHWTVVPAPDEAQAGLCEPAPATALVTPPDETTQLAVPWTMDPVCQHGRIEVTPLAMG
jgi:uncharacterized protein DUF4232/predicted metal-binding integral membrane protein DUF2182